MGSKSNVFALFLSLNLLFFVLVSAINSPPPRSAPPPVPRGTCPIDLLKLQVCAGVLSGILQQGIPPVNQCCTGVQGLTDLEATICFCTAIKAEILGSNLNVTLAVNFLTSICEKTVPSGYQCA